jgi:hypothetical protein
VRVAPSRLVSYIRRVRPSLALVALVVLLSGCECSDAQARNDAMLFLDRFDDIDVDTPLEERRTQVEAIRQLALTDETVLQTRDLCVSAHQALIDAEDQHALARHLLVESGGTTETDVPPEAAARISTAIDESNEAIERSRELFPRCTREVNALERRFHRRHS